MQQIATRLITHIQGQYQVNPWELEELIVLHVTWYTANDRFRTAAVHVLLREYIRYRPYKARQKEDMLLTTTSY